MILSGIIKPLKQLGFALFYMVSGLIAGTVFATNLEQSPAVIPVTQIPENVYLRLNNDPNDEVWRRVPEYPVTLNMAPPVHQSVALRFSAKQTSVTARISVVSDDQHIYFRLRWPDASKNMETKIGRYSDAAALQFPLTKQDASIMMGSPVAPVGIWYWRADRMNIGALIARGPGTLAKAQDETLGGRAFYRFNPDTEQGYWYLVVSKDLRQHTKNAVSFRRQTIPFAVALWQGDAHQRDGLKRVSEWLTIDLSKLGKKP